MELQYVKALEKHKLKKSDLPEDAQIGIGSIEEALRALTMLEKKGKKPLDKTLKKLKAMDKWVYYEILDHLNDTEENEEEMPITPKELVDDVKQQAAAANIPPVVVPPVANKKPEVPPVQNKTNNTETQTGVETLGIEIETELEELHKAGVSQLTFDELKSKAKKTYSLIFDTYDETGDNGVQTTKFSLLETEPKVFTLKQL